MSWLLILFLEVNWHCLKLLTIQMMLIYFVNRNRFDCKLWVNLRHSFRHFSWSFYKWGITTVILTMGWLEKGRSPGKKRYEILESMHFSLLLQWWQFLIPCVHLLNLLLSQNPNHRKHSVNHVIFWSFLFLSLLFDQKQPTCWTKKNSGSFTTTSWNPD